MSLLLDALKQAEKAKQEKTEDTDAASASHTLSLDDTHLQVDVPPSEPDQPPDEDTGPVPTEVLALEAELEPTEPTGVAGEQAGPDEPAQVIKTDTGEIKLTTEESQGLSLDLGEFARQLAESTGRFDKPPSEDSMSLKTGPVSDRSQTLPSIQSVRDSLNEFYAETGKVPPTRGDAESTAPQAEHPSGGDTQPSPHAARNIFAAKGEAKGGSRAMLWVAVSGLVLAGLAVGGYFWWSLSGMQPITPPRPRIAVAPPAAPPPAPARTAQTAPAPRPEPPAPRPIVSYDTAPVSAIEAANEELRLATTTQPAGPVAGASAETGGQSAAAIAASTEASAQPPAAAPPSGTQPSGPATAPNRAPAAEPRAEHGPPATTLASVQPASPQAARPAPSPPPPIRIRRQPKVDPAYRNVERAFQAFRAGDSKRAERLYRRVLAQRPRNRDALLGLAAIALRAGRAGEAQETYQRLLRFNPQDRVALTALTELQGGLDPLASESRLTQLLEKSPGAAYLHFALGNLYAAQSRWPEAQQAYFNAYHGAPENGDYRFNLAVSLDHLGQSKAALDYYRLALASSETQRVGFDRSQVLARIAALADGTDRITQ